MRIVRSLLGRIAPGYRLLSEWTQEYDRIISARLLTAKTLQNRQNNMRHIVETLGHRPMRSIRPHEIALEVRRVWDSGRHVAARRMLLEAKELFAEAVIAGWIDTNPAQPLRALPSSVKRSRLSLEQWQEIHSWATRSGIHWFAYALKLALVSGQRRADIVKMAGSHVWNDHLHIVQQKTGSRIALPLALRLDEINAELGELIDEGLRHNAPGELLLRKATGGGYGPAALSASFARARNAVFPLRTWEDRTPPTFHEIRSLSERLHRARGVDTKTLLGHSKQSMTDLYNNDRGLTRNDWKTLIL